MNASLIATLAAALDPWAILWGCIAALGLSAVAGALMGTGLITDISNDPDEAGTPDGPDDDALERAMHRPMALLQLTVLSLLTTVVAGALTARLAPGAPLLNAGAVGAVGTLLSVPLARAAPTLPRPLVIFGILSTLPATLLGAWIVA